MGTDPSPPSITYLLRQYVAIRHNYIRIPVRNKCNKVFPCNNKPTQPEALDEVTNQAAATTTVQNIIQTFAPIVQLTIRRYQDGNYEGAVLKIDDRVPVWHWQFRCAYVILIRNQSELLLCRGDHTKTMDWKYRQSVFYIFQIDLLGVF